MLKKVMEAPEARRELALGLVNSFEASRGRLEDRIARPADFVDWLARQGAWLGPGDPPGSATPLARLLHDEARRLRTAVRAALDDVASGRPIGEEARHAIDRALAFGAPGHRFETAEDGCVLRTVETGSDTRAPLAAIALGAAELLTTVSPDRIRPCAADGCPGWFVDTSKSGRRRWCSMARCGNRAKAARHRRRAAEQG